MADLVAKLEGPAKKDYELLLKTKEGSLFLLSSHFSRGLQKPRNSV